LIIDQLILKNNSKTISN